ncbi:interleukin-17 receptor A isoform X2 [Neoarius graeffei]|uniref:interleukin-17 receptor A isoform X2 n=1 Tax=Neoarius graeffei TaxID=443677 RepID=UPI00298D227D|nr:interleukin-17 receptor A isoform X2 [Neoarius graeffei]
MVHSACPVLCYILTKMIFIFLLLSGVIVQISALRLIEQPPLQCSQEGLSCSVQVSRPNCSVKDWTKPRSEAPSPYPHVESRVKSKEDERNETVPVLSLTLTQFSDANIYRLQGMKIHVHEMTTNNSLCVCYIFKNNFSWIQRPDFEPWSFALDQIVLDPGMAYQVSVSNLPKPDVGGNAKLINITVPGCEHRKLRSLRVCLENGSLWDHNMTWSVRDNWGNGLMIEVIFNTAPFSDMYKVYIQSADLHTELSHKVSKDNHTSISVNFSLNPWQSEHCEVFFGIKPFFIRCMEKCSHHQQKVNLCSYLSSSSHNTTDKGNLETVPVQERSKVLIIYSQDHPMYTEIVLKLCAFLMAECGIEVTLDLLDSTCLSTIGSIQWLDMQRKILANTSDKILILCSPGVCAKWNAMCGGRRVVTREDVCSPMGDMLTPALSLIIPEFVRAPSFGKYAIAYFDDVCSEKDVPAVFHVAVKYQLMKQFEELFFRLLNKEKYEPGRIKHIDGIGEDGYYSCPALKDAIKAFQAYQLKNPNWFEMELVDTHEEFEGNDLEQEDGTENSGYCVLHNKLLINEISVPVLTNIVKGQ